MQLKSLKKKLKEAEKRAISAERMVKALLKEVDMKEGKISPPKILFPRSFCKVTLKNDSAFSSFYREEIVARFR